MKTVNLFLVLIVVFWISAEGQTHPYLYFNSSDLTAIRNRAVTSGTPANQIWNVILNWQSNVYSNDNNRYINTLAADFWSYENVYSLALAYKINQDATYLSCVRRVIWGDPPTPIPTGMLSQPLGGWFGRMSQS